MFGLLDVVEHDLHWTPLTVDDARKWLIRLNGSPLSFHLDDNPVFCVDGVGARSFDQPTAEFLRGAVRACRCILGEAEMWRLYYEVCVEDPCTVSAG